MADRRRRVLRRRLDDSETAGSEGEDGVRVEGSEDALSQSGDESDTILDQEEEDSEYESAEENQDSSFSKDKDSDSTITTPPRGKYDDNKQQRKGREVSRVEEVDADEDRRSGEDNREDVVIEEDYIEGGEEEGQFEDKEDEGERGDGDGEEEKNLDADEDDKNPAYIPRKGAFFMHDMRSDEGHKGPKPRRDKKLWQDDGKRWGHDKFIEEEQAPKHREEIVTIYGYDVRRDSAPPRARGRGFRGRGGGGRKERHTLSDFMGKDDRDREAPPPRERGRGRKPRGRGRWNEPQDPERPYRTQWSSRNYGRNEDNSHNESDDRNEQEFNGQGYARRHENREITDRGNYRGRPERDYRGRGERDYGRNRQNYTTTRQNRQEYEQEREGYQQREQPQVREQVSPRDYQRDFAHQPQQRWSTADDSDVTKNIPDKQDQEVYSVPQDLVIESRTQVKVEAETKGEASKPRETKSYSRERHQRSLKQESVPAQGEQEAAVAADAEQSSESLEKQLQGLRITVKGTERKAQFVSDQEALRQKMEKMEVVQPPPSDVIAAVVHTPSAGGDGPVADRREQQSGRTKRYSSQRQRSAGDAPPQRPTVDQSTPQFYEQGFQGQVYHPSSTPPATISAPPPPRSMGGTPPRSTVPNTPPHSVRTTPPPPQGPPPAVSTARMPSPGPTSTVPHIHTVAPPPVVSTAGLPPGLPRHPMAHGEAQTMLHQGIMVRPEIAMHPGMQHPSPTHMVNNPPPPLMHPSPNLPAQQQPPPPRPSFPPPPQFVPGAVINYGQPPGPHYQIGGPVALQHYPAVSTISGQPPPTIPAQAIPGQPPPAIPVRPPPTHPPPQAPPPQHLPPPPPGAPPPPAGSSQIYGGITYYSPEQQLGIKRPPTKRQANPIPIEVPPERPPRGSGDQLQQMTEAQMLQLQVSQAQPHQVEVPQAHLQQVAQAQQQQFIQAQQQQQLVQAQQQQQQQQQQQAASQQSAQPAPKASPSVHDEGKQE